MEQDMEVTLCADNLLTYFETGICGHQEDTAATHSHPFLE